MGRPKGSKNKNTIAKDKTNVKTESKKAPINTAVETQETTEVKKVPKTDPKPISAKYECELCGKPIYDSPRIIRCTELTGFALYYRSIQDQYKVCNECGKEFNDMVEKWLIKKGAKLRAGYIDKKEIEKEKELRKE